MSDNHRREFLKNVGIGVAAAATAGELVQTASAAADRKFVIGLIGCGGRGTGVATTFSSLGNCEIAYACDPDLARANTAAKKLSEKSMQNPKVVQDLRRVLDDKSVDAVIIATPDHWHGPAALLAMEAGKHVYVEKPCCHNIREGRLMIETARRLNRVVQTGTQSRSGEHVIKAMELLRSGAIGEVLVAKAWNSQKRKNIGHATPSEAPTGLDYKMWLGPAPHVPFQENRLHYSWHWWYAFGTGDFGNDGVHDTDIARWGLGVETHPTRVTSVGGKYFFDDDQQFPDTQYAVFEYPGDGAVGHRKQLIFEQRIWSPYRQEGFENGNAFYGTNGMLLLGKNDGWQLFGPKNKLLESGKSEDREKPHARDFLDCIVSGKRPRADIEVGHLSAALCHLGNLTTRLGRAITFDPQKEQVVGDEEANRFMGREYEPGHWAVPKGG